jgi:glycopeptide antibiotics resistance protein
MKSLARAVFALYVLVLLWLVLFKFSYDLGSVLTDYQTRSLSLVPFAESTRANIRETIDNAIVFLPFGLLISASFKQMKFWQKLASVFVFSLFVEVVQYALAIGVTDTTDVLANTLGGLAGLGVYGLGRRYVSEQTLEKVFSVVIAVLLVALLLVRVLVIKVRY